MSALPSIAVVVLNYNTIDLLKEYLPLLVKSCVGKADIYVTDNASTDGSAEWLKNRSDIKMITLEKNYGYAGGYNRALKQIKSDYYVLINSDVEVTPGWLDNLVEPLNRDASIAAVQPKILMLKDKYAFEYAGAGGGLLDKWGYPFCRGRIFDTLEGDRGQYDDETEIFWATGACFAIRSSLFHKADGFDEDFFAHMEEIDLCWRLQHMGYKVWYNGKSAVYHLGGGTLKMGSHRKYFLNYRNNLAMLTKNYPGAWFRIILWKMVLDGLSAFNFLFAGKVSVFLAVIKAHFAYWSRFGYWMDKRRSIRRTKGKNILYPKSIVWQYFALGKVDYAELIKDH